MTKIRRRLSEKEASFLGLPLKKTIKGHGNNRYMISKEDYDEVLSLRLQNTKENFKEVTKTLNKNGEITNTVQKLRSTTISAVPEGFEIVKISTNKSTGQQWVQSKPQETKERLIGDVSFSYENIRNILDQDIKKTKLTKPHKYKNKKEGVIKWADLHLGAHIRNVLMCDDYDSEILKTNLLKSVLEVNIIGFKKTHVHIHGDIIESFSGLNHINSWHSMEKDLIGAKVIKVASEILDHVLSKVKNLGEIKIVGGNHDRLSKNNDEDVKGGAADLIAYCLSLKGYNVEFNPMVISHEVNGIMYILLHGDKGLSKLSTADIILNYGKQGVYNYICEAHLHSIIEKLTAKQIDNFKIVKDDQIDRRREHLSSFMTGNFYSSSNGWSTNTGYQINWATDRGRPMVLKASF